LLAAVAESADARDSKSRDGDIVSVQVRSAAPKKQLRIYPELFSFIPV
jgi:hypothetical protein